MTLLSFRRRPIHAIAAAPIRGYNRRSFVIGWMVIIGLGLAGYALASSQLSSPDNHVRLASTSTSGTSQPAFPRS